MIVGLDHVQVAAPDWLLGPGSEVRRRLARLDEIAKPPALAARGGVWFRAGTSELHVGVTDDFVPATKAHPALRVASPAELERLAALLERHGVSISRPDPDEVPGTARLHISDPWGNRVELLA